MFVDKFKKTVDNYEKICGKLYFYDKIITKILNLTTLYNIFFQKSISKFKTTKKIKFPKKTWQIGNTWCIIDILVIL